MIRDGRASAGPVDIRTFLRQVNTLSPSPLLCKVSVGQGSSCKAKGNLLPRSNRPGMSLLVTLQPSDSQQGISSRACIAALEGILPSLQLDRQVIACIRTAGHVIDMHQARCSSIPDSSCSLGQTSWLRRQTTAPFWLHEAPMQSLHATLEELEEDTCIQVMGEAVLQYQTGLILSCCSVFTAFPAFAAGAWGAFWCPILQGNNVLTSAQSEKVSRTPPCCSPSSSLQRHQTVCACGTARGG